MASAGVTWASFSTGAVRHDFVRVGEEAPKKITQHTIKAHVDATVRKSFNDLPANIARQHLANDFWITTSLIQATNDRHIR